MTGLTRIAVFGTLLLATCSTRTLTEAQAFPQNPDPNAPKLTRHPSSGAADAPAATEPASAKPAARVSSGGPLQDQSRLEIVRNVSGEYAKMVTSFPGGRTGFRVKAGEPIDQDALHKAIQSAGAALNPGDNVQITKLEFQGHQLMLELNGGSHTKRSWRDHVQLGVGGIGGGPTTRTSTTTHDDTAGPVVAAKPGATLYLDFGRDLPDMTPDEVKQYLSVVLDFSKQRSAAVQWASTLPPEIQQAISEKRPATGMDHEEILAAIGRPDRKIRERDAEGNDTEDWIYGHPPAKTLFVRFSGDKVVDVEQYPK